MLDSNDIVFDKTLLLNRPRVFQRSFRHVPPLFPFHFIKKGDRDHGMIYQARYSNPYGESMFLTGVCGWGDFMGDIIPEIQEKLTELAERDNKEQTFMNRISPRPPYDYGRHISRVKKFTQVT